MNILDSTSELNLKCLELTKRNVYVSHENILYVLAFCKQKQR